MNAIKTSIQNATTKGDNKKPEHPLMYKGFLIKSKKTKNGFKLYAHNLITDVFINPIYNNWESLKLIIENIK